MLKHTVSDSGNPHTASVMVIGEAPGAQEVRQGKPFVGPSGQVLRGWLGMAGIDPSEVYFTNVLNFMPPVKGGDLEDAIKSKRVSTDDINNGIEHVRSTVRTLPNLRVIAPVGNYALSAFTENWGKTVFRRLSAGITACRGSVTNYPGTQHSSRHDVLVIPTIHPAAILRNRQWEQRCIHDWRKIASYLRTTGKFQAPKRHHNILPTPRDVQALLNDARDKPISVDIETWGGELKCIGFALNPRESLVIPTTQEFVGGVFRRGNLWYDLIKEVCESSSEKILQNGLFDAWWLHQYDIKLNNFHWDTLAMHHAIDPRESHSLDFLASILTNQPYWKDEAKDADEILRVAKSVGMDRLYIYNGLDCVVTYEIFCKLYDQLEELGLLKFYLERYADMIQPLLSMMLNGMFVDLKEMQKVYDELLDESINLRDQAVELSSHDMFVFDKTQCERDMLNAYYHEGCTDYETMYSKMSALTKTLKSGVQKPIHKETTIQAKWKELRTRGISDAKLNHVLYDVWEAPKGKRTEKTEKVAADNVSLKRVKLAVADRKRGACVDNRHKIDRLIDIKLEHAHVKKLSSFINPAKVDPDSRMRFSYKFTTKSGRLASAENPRKTGMNGQNIPHRARRVFKPTPGNLFLEVDLSQAEGRVVKVLTGDDELIASARRLPTEGDEHIENAMTIFGLDQSAWEALSTKQAYDYRQSGKRVVHACNYDMGGNMCSDALLKEGFTFTPYECRILIENRHERYPQIRRWHKEIVSTILAKRELTTSWGRRVLFNDQWFDDEVYKFAYSYIPQSEIGDLTNEGLKRFYYWSLRQRLAARLAAQVHDSILVDTPIPEIHDVMHFLHEVLTQVRHYGGCLGRDVALSIPVDFKLGTSWGTGREFKYLPSQSEIDEVVALLAIKTQS